MKLINIGFGNLVNSDKLIAIAAPVKRIVQDAKSKGMLVDATCGRKCKAVLVTEDDHIVLSAISAEAIHNRTVESEEQKDEQ